MVTSVAGTHGVVLFTFMFVIGLGPLQYLQPVLVQWWPDVVDVGSMLAYRPRRQANIEPTLGGHNYNVIYPLDVELDNSRFLYMYDS